MLIKPPPYWQKALAQPSSATITPSSHVAVDPRSSWISFKRAAEMLDVSESTLWRWVKFRPEFPKPVKLSPGCTRLNMGELQAFITLVSGHE